IHDIAIPQFGVDSDDITGKGASTAVVFRANKKGEFEYLCTLPGHKQAGMAGKLVVGTPVAKKKAEGLNVAQDPTNVGKPVGKRGPRKLTDVPGSTEVGRQLDDGMTCTYCTFNNKVPVPFIRARVAAAITVNMSTAKDSDLSHSVDFHAVTGPGGGAAVAQAA